MKKLDFKILKTAVESKLKELLLKAKKNEVVVCEVRNVTIEPTTMIGYDDGFGYLAEIDELSDLYLESFPKETNKIFRTRRKFDCSCCKNFIKNAGKLVFIDQNGKKDTIWNVKIENEPEFQKVVDTLNEKVLSKEIISYFLTREYEYGKNTTIEKLETGKTIEWSHFNFQVPDFLRTDRVGEKRGKLNTKKQVLQRALKELTMDSVETVLELIKQNSLYKGEEWQSVIIEFKKIKKETKDLTEEQLDLYCWYKAKQVSAGFARLRNTSMGTLLVDLSEGKDLMLAIKNYDKITAPENYQRRNPIITEKMKKAAIKTIQELGLENSLKRRFANLNDITVNEVLFTNIDVKDAPTNMPLSIFDELKTSSKKQNKQKYDNLKEIQLKDFLENVVPEAESIEILFENKLENKLMSLVTAVDTSAKSIFKWDNNFSWAYKDNITDSSTNIKSNVKKAGGRTDAILRVSMQWNDGEIWNRDDYDLHVIEPGGREIYFGDFRAPNSMTPGTGQLDVDVTSPRKGIPEIENITWTDFSKMEKGKYQIFVRNYSSCGQNDGFKIEIEYQGEIHNFEYKHSLRRGEDVKVAILTLKENGELLIDNEIKLTESKTLQKDIWGIKTQEFIPVKAVINSPNYWGEQGIGNHHYFFILQDCKNDETPNGFFNEFLTSELKEHKNVTDALGYICSVEETNEQLSGLGFSTTREAEFIVKVKGKTERMLKVKV